MTELTPDESQKRESKAYNLTILVYLLQALHPLFGITAVIGMLVNHTQIQHVQGSVYHSHFKWQIVTFWLGLIAYVLGFYSWLHFGLWLFIPLVSAIIGLRIVRGFWQLMARQPVGNFW